MSVWSKEVFANNLLYYMNRKGISQKELSEILGVSAPTVNEWIKAKKYPRIDKIEMLANYFGILKSDLIEDKKMKEYPEEMAILAASIMRDSELLEMIQKFKKLSERNRIAVIQMIDNLSE
jgi:transcriptional regulator with XRE-family HTH domain